MLITGKEQVQTSNQFDLDNEDIILFEKLKNGFSTEFKRARRDAKFQTFIEQLVEIHRFCVKNDENDYKRYLACGICFVDFKIWVNNSKLRSLLGKSKASINLNFASLGYETIPLNKKNCQQLFDTIPSLKENYNEHRNWTLRQPINGLGIYDSKHSPYFAQIVMDHQRNYVANLKSAQATSPQTHSLSFSSSNQQYLALSPIPTIDPSPAPAETTNINEVVVNSSEIKTDNDSNGFFDDEFFLFDFQSNDDDFFAL